MFSPDFFGVIPQLKNETFFYFVNLIILMTLKLPCMNRIIFTTALSLFLIKGNARQSITTIVEQGIDAVTANPGKIGVAAIEARPTFLMLTIFIVLIFPSHQNLTTLSFPAVYLQPHN